MSFGGMGLAASELLKTGGNFDHQCTFVWFFSSSMFDHSAVGLPPRPLPIHEELGRPLEGRAQLEKSSTYLKMFYATEPWCCM